MKLQLHVAGSLASSLTKISMVHSLLMGWVTNFLYKHDFIVLFLGDSPISLEVQLEMAVLITSANNGPHS